MSNIFKTADTPALTYDSEVILPGGLVDYGDTIKLRKTKSLKIQCLDLGDDVIKQLYTLAKETFETSAITVDRVNPYHSEYFGYTWVLTVDFNIPVDSDSLLGFYKLDKFIKKARQDFYQNVIGAIQYG